MGNVRKWSQWMKRRATRKGTAGEVRGEELEPRAGRWHLLCQGTVAHRQALFGPLSHRPS